MRIHSHTDAGPKKTFFFCDLINYCSLVDKEYEQGKQNLCYNVDTVYLCVAQINISSLGLSEKDITCLFSKS